MLQLAMLLTLKRHTFTDRSTAGHLLIEGDYFCDTLEDVDRHLESGGTKIPGETAIPRGTYDLIIDFSQRFQKPMPRILKVPGYEGVRIHAGNTNKDTEGCPLVGKSSGPDGIISSRITFLRLMDELEGKKNMRIEIK